MSKYFFAYCLPACLEPMVFTHSTPMNMNETSEQVDNIPDGTQDSSFIYRRDKTLSSGGH